MAEELAIDDIHVNDRLRQTDPDHVEGLAASIRECGRVLQPIVVTKTRSGQWVLVAGAHRLAAARLAGHRTIPVQVHENINDLQARLIEIDENLIQHVLNPLDRAIFLAERKRVYEELHPETKKGAKNQHNKDKLLTDTMSFSENAAVKIGLDPRSIRRAVAIAQNLIPDVRSRIAGSKIATCQKDLELLSKQEPARQQEITDLLMRKEDPATSVREAVSRIEGHQKAKPNQEDASLKRLMDAWRHASKASRSAFVAGLNANDRASIVEMMMDDPATAEWIAARSQGYLPGKEAAE